MLSHIEQNKMGKTVPNSKVPKKTTRKIKKRRKSKWKRKRRNLTRAKEHLKTSKAKKDIKSCKVKEDVKDSKVKEEVKSETRGVKPVALGENFSPLQEAHHRNSPGAPSPYAKKESGRAGSKGSTRSRTSSGKSARGARGKGSTRSRNLPGSSSKELSRKLIKGTLQELHHLTPRRSREEQGAREAQGAG